LPYGPVFKNLSRPLLEILKAEFLKILKEENAIFCRFDFTPPVKDAAEEKLLEQFFVKSPSYSYRSSYFQPRTEWLLNLEPPEEEIFFQIHKKTRYCFRQAEKGGIKAKIITSQLQKYFDNFYALLKETAKRDNFHLHPRNYYQAIFEETEKRQNAYLAIGYLPSNKNIANKKIIIRIFKNSDLFFLSCKIKIDKTINDRILKM